MKNEWLVRLSSELDVTSNPRGAPLESFPSVDYSFMCLHDARNYKPQRKGLTRSHVCTVHVGICGTSAALLMSHISAQHKQASYQHKHTHTISALSRCLPSVARTLGASVCAHICTHTHPQPTLASCLAAAALRFFTRFSRYLHTLARARARRERDGRRLGSAILRAPLRHYRRQCPLT